MLLQLERMRSEYTPPPLTRLMITHTIDQFILDPKSKSKLQISGIWPKFKFLNLEKKLQLRDKMCDMKWIWRVLEYCRRYRADTILSTDGQTDGRTDGETDGQGETSIPPLQLRWARV